LFEAPLPAVLNRHRRHGYRVALGLSLLATLVTLALGALRTAALSSDTTEAGEIVLSTPPTAGSLRASQPPAVLGAYPVTLTPELLREMMRADIDANSEYIDWLREQHGSAVAEAFKLRVSHTYTDQIDEMKAAGVASRSVSLKTVTLWSSLTFSTMSYDARLQPKDPVSVVFMGNSNADFVYRYLIDLCAHRQGCPPSLFQDDKGGGASGNNYECSASTQWVLMGNAGETPELRPSTRAVMKSGDQCLVGDRDHMRIFGAATANDVFGDWSVATPHYEHWTGTFHVVGSWTSARDVFTSTVKPSFGDGSGPSVSYREMFSWQSSGLFQGVPFDGIGVAIELQR
jgi:hypothetical protein